MEWFGFAVWFAILVYLLMINRTRTRYRMGITFYLCVLFVISLLPEAFALLWYLWAIGGITGLFLRADFNGAERLYLTLSALICAALAIGMSFAVFDTAAGYVAAFAVLSSAIWCGDRRKLVVSAVFCFFAAMLASGWKNGVPVSPWTVISGLGIAAAAAWGIAALLGFALQSRQNLL